MDQPTILFLTVCALDRAPILAEPTVQAALERIWPAADHWRVGNYLLMPDHLHLFCSPGVIEPAAVKRWARFWKTRLTRAIPGLAGRLQRDCWDTQIRTRQHYDEKLAYMRRNPVRAGICDRPEDWPYQGRLNTFRW